MKVLQNLKNELREAELSLERCGGLKASPFAMAIYGSKILALREMISREEKK